MNLLSSTAALGLISLLIGVLLVNVVSTPRTSLAGTIIAGIGVVFLAFTAIGLLLF
jgi:hypothetical protein